ncbi:MBL fold metallo-hydrolase [bacterium]|nr:MBL fold metallo-hydrolase [bacterium]
MTHQNWRLEVLPVGPFRMNAVLLTGDGPDGPECILVDPGDEAPRLLGRIEASGARLVALLATHGHLDHVGAAAEIQDVHPLPLRCHPDDVPIIARLPEFQAGYGLPRTRVPRTSADLEDGARVPFAGGEIEVRHVPGHSPGELMLVLHGMSPLHALVGDCLFHGSVGRTDLPGGDFATLEKSIRERIYTLPDETVVVSGHGPDTTVGHERTTNPFVRGLDAG